MPVGVIPVGLNHSDFLTCILAVSYFKYKDRPHLEGDMSENSQSSAVFILGCVKPYLRLGDEAGS